MTEETIAASSKVLLYALRGVFAPLVIIVCAVLIATAYIIVHRVDSNLICFSALVLSFGVIVFACFCFFYALTKDDLILRGDYCYEQIKKCKYANETESEIQSVSHGKKGRSNSNKTKV